MTRYDWRELETEVGLEALPAFHRAFLASRGVPDPAAIPLRRVQQAVERELNRLVRDGHAVRKGEQILVHEDLIDDLAVVDAIRSRLQRLPEPA